MKNIVVICENIQSVEAIKSAGQELGINVVCEIQENCKIQNEISEAEIRKACAVLFVISFEVEDIEKIERFIDCEYYEVEPKYVINDAKSVIKEIMEEIN